MAKHKKKRNKSYTGADAAMTRPTIIRISAANRSRLGQWWFDNKKAVKPILIASAVILFIIITVIEIIRIASGN